MNLHREARGSRRYGHGRSSRGLQSASSPPLRIALDLTAGGSFTSCDGPSVAAICGGVAVKSGEVTRRSEPPAEAKPGDAGPADRAHSRPQLGASALAFAVLLALTPPGSGQAATADGIDPNDPAQVALGEALYAAQCASCHGTDLEGQRDWQRQRPDGTFPAPPHDETGHTWHHADALLFDYTKHGGAAVVGGNFASNMPGFGDLLTDDEIRAVIAYIKSTWPPPIRQRQEQRNAGG